MTDQKRGLVIEVTTSFGEKLKISPLRNRTVNELAQAISQAGVDGICYLKGEDGNCAALVLNNLAVIECDEVNLPDD